MPSVTLHDVIGQGVDLDLVVERGVASIVLRDAATGRALGPSAEVDAADLARVTARLAHADRLAS
jgi:hypothetical protein